MCLQQEMTHNPRAALFSQAIIILEASENQGILRLNSLQGIHEKMWFSFIVNSECYADEMNGKCGKLYSNSMVLM